MTCVKLLAEGQPAEFHAAIEDVRAWMRGVDSGEVTAGRLLILAVRRQLADEQQAGERGWAFDETLAASAIWFIEAMCKHTKTSPGATAGDPLTLTPSQRFIVFSLIGWRSAETNLRRFQRAHIEVARKFGKSTFAAALLLLLMVFDVPQDPDAEIYCAATKEKQARIVWSQAKKMVQANPVLQRRVQDLAASLVHKSLGSILQPIGSDSDTTDGLNTSAVVMDELHAWQARHRGLFEKLMTAGGARLQPLWIIITTAGDTRADLWIEQRKWAVQTAEAVISDTVADDRLFVFICCFDYPGVQQCQFCDDGCGRCEQYQQTFEQVDHKTGQSVAHPALKAGEVPPDDPFDHNVWIKANPNLGQTVRWDAYETECDQARASPAAFSRYLRYYGNVMVSSESQLVTPELWAAGNAKPWIGEGQVARGGFDLGRSDDFAAWAVALSSESDSFGEGEPESCAWDFVSKSYTCEARAEELESDQFKRWIDSGALVVHSGDQVDFDLIERDIVEAHHKYGVTTWAYDPTFAAQIGQHLVNVHGIEAVRFSQSARWYNPAIRELLRALRRRDVCHGGDEVLAWQAGNLIVKRNARDEYMPDKATSAFKIDGMVALLMAMSETLYHSGSGIAGRSVYETQEIRTL